MRSVPPWICMEVQDPAHRVPERSRYLTIPPCSCSVTIMRPAWDSSTPKARSRVNRQGAGCLPVVACRRYFAGFWAALAHLRNGHDELAGCNWLAGCNGVGVGACRLATCLVTVQNQMKPKPVLSGKRHGGNLHAKESPSPPTRQPLQSGVF